MKLIKIKKIRGTIEVITGLHIGAGSDTIEIGGMDNPIIRNPFTKEPYIPGSSIKGKMRSLMEWKENKVLQNNGEPCKCGECNICRVFGTSAGGDEEKAKRRGPTRLIVRDAMLSIDSIKKFEDGKPLTEEKSENNINRITADAVPRSIERVVPGTTFKFEISYRIIDMGDDGEKDEKNFKDIVLTALALLQNDYLGGGGSRGNGKIEFKELKDDEGNKITLPEV